MIAYTGRMNVRAKHDGKFDMGDDATEHDHDAWVRAKVERGLEQSRDRASMIPVEEIWRALGLAR